VRIGRGFQNNGVDQVSSVDLIHSLVSRHSPVATTRPTCGFKTPSQALADVLR
jgi:hypothetical protein